MIEIRKSMVLFAFLLSILPLLTVTSTSNAKFVTWHVDEQFTDSGRITHVAGDFTFYSKAPWKDSIVAWSLEVDADGVPAPALNPVLLNGPETDNSAGAFYVTAGDWGYLHFFRETPPGARPQYSLSLFFDGDPDRLLGPGPIPLTEISFLIWPDDSATRPETWNVTYSGELRVVPIPPSALLFGAGLIGLAWARRKQLLGR